MEILLLSFTICALTATGYDCDDEWIIEIYEGRYVPCVNETDIGCALYGGEYVPPIMRLGIDSLDKIDRYGNTTFAHEAEHIICKCNWHG